MKDEKPEYLCGKSNHPDSCSNEACWDFGVCQKIKVESFGKCKDCGAELNEGEAKTFTVCDSCWDKAYKVESEESQTQLWDEIYNNAIIWHTQEFRHDYLNKFTIQRKKP